MVRKISRRPVSGRKRPADADPWSAADRRFMQLAFAEARRVKGKTLPNPPVGAVLVKGGRLLAAGGTRAAGEAHAEIVALENAGARARGSTLYVTLEPCNHHGKTPPCTDALVAAGVRKVVAAVADPNPQAAGGLKKLRHAGIETQTGLMGEEAADFYAGFFFHATRGRARIDLKVAQSLDGRINRKPGVETAITGEAAREWSHGLREQVDAIVIGGHTLRIDDPDLTPRAGRKGETPRPAPEAIIVSRRGPFPPGLKLFARDRRAKTVVLSERKDGLPEWVDHEPLPSGAGQIETAKALLGLFAKRGYHRVLVEGGRRVWALFLNTGTWDGLYIITAPKLLPEGDRWDAFLDRDWGKALKFRNFALFGEDLWAEFGKDS